MWAYLKNISVEMVLKIGSFAENLMISNECPPLTTWVCELIQAKLEDLKNVHILKYVYMCMCACIVGNKTCIFLQALQDQNPSN